MPNKTEIRVRYSETDQMGVVYHSNYLVWMEIGRAELFRKLGLSYKTIEDKGIMFPVIEANLKYKRSALYDDLLVVETFLEKYSAVKIYMGYNIFRKEDMVLLAKGKTVHAIVDKNGKPVSIKKVPWLKKVFDKIL